MQPGWTLPKAAAALSAVFAISSSAVLVRYAAAPAVVLALWRCGVASVLLAPGGRTPLQRRHLVRLGIAGAALAIHFSAWLASLELTTVAASVTLVTTAPVFVALFGAALGRRSTRRQWLGIAAAVAGSAIIAGADLGSGPDAILGDFLALLGAAMMAVYLLVGESLRAELDVARYTSAAYGVAAVGLVVMASVGGLPMWGFDRTTWLAIGAMVIGPQLAGHTVLNGLLTSLGSVSVSLVLLLEPLGAATLVWLLFGELPGPGVWFGGPLVLGGLALAALAQPRPAVSSTSSQSAPASAAAPPADGRQ